MIKVIIADDHYVFRQGLRLLLENTGYIKVVGEARDGEEVVEKADLLNPDIVIMDISMPKLDGIQSARLIKKKSPHIKIIVLTMHHAIEFIKSAIRPEISGYVLKENAFEDLVEAIDKVMNNEKYLSPQVKEVLEDLEKIKGEISSTLTPRERQVLDLIGKGLSNKEIARKLKISIKTVETHRTNIMQKLDIHTTAKLIKYAIEMKQGR